MGLDAMFGAGAAAAYAAACDISAIIPGAVTTLTEVDSTADPAFEVNTTISWATSGGEPIGSFINAYRPTAVHCSGLWIEPAYRQHGLNTKLIAGVVPVLPSWGLRTYTMLPNDEGERALRLVGYEQMQGGFGMPIPAIRPLQYVAWAADGKPPESEPIWHAELVAQFAAEDAATAEEAGV